MEYLIKIAFSSILVVLVSEISKRSTLMGGLLASLPVVSLLAIIFLYSDTKDISKVSELSISIFWLVLPSLVFFVIFPLLLSKNFSFYPSMGVSIVATIVCYYLMILILAKFGIKI